MQKVLFALVGLAAGLALASLPARAVTDTVTAKRFEVFDDEGRSRIVMGVVSGCPSVNFLGTDGKRTMQMYVRDGRPEFLMFHEDGDKNRVRIFLEQDGSAHATLFDQAGVGRVDMNVDKAGEPHVDFADKKGTVLRRLPK